MDETSGVPSYLIAAENHNFLSPARANESVFSATADIVTKFVPSAIAAGVNEIYNIGPTVGNFFGGHYERSDLRKRLVELDNDLALYYDEHKLGVDTAGFVIGSMAPGLGGMKALNLGQAALRGAFKEGYMGGMTGVSLGLLAPNRELYLANAISSIRSSGSVFSLTEANTLKTLASGFSQNAMEGAAFEIAVAATMNQSPILDGQSRTDLMWNVVAGAGINGVIGGVLSGAAKSWKIAKAGRLAEEDLGIYKITQAPDAGASNSDKILNYLKQMDEMPAPYAEGDLAKRAQDMHRTKLSTLDNLVRGELTKLSDSDQALVGSIYARSKGVTFEDNLNLFLDSASVGRVEATSALETAHKKLIAKIEKAGPDAPDLSAEDMDLLANPLKFSYLKLWGEGASAAKGAEILDGRPAILSIFDKMKNAEVVLKKDGIQIGSKFYAQVNNPHMGVNVMNMSHFQSEARQLWAERLGKWTDQTAPEFIHAEDFALLDKSIRDGLTSIRVIPESGVIKDAFTLSGKEAMIEFKKRQGIETAKKLLGPVKDVTHLAEVRADKLMAATGTHFTIVDDAVGGYNGFFTRLKGSVKGGMGQDISVEGHAIAIERSALATMKTRRLMQTLKHEEGHSIFNALLLSNGVTKENLFTRFPLLAKETMAISEKARPGGLKHYSKIEWAHEAFADAFGYLAMHPAHLAKYPEFKNFAGHLIRPVTPELLSSLSVRTLTRSQEEVARMLNVTTDSLSGNFAEGWHDARALYRKDFFKLLDDNGVTGMDRPADPLATPSFAKITHRPSRIEVDGNQLEGYAVVAQRTKMYQESADRVATQILKENFPSIPDEVLLTGNVGPSFAGFSNGLLGSLQSIFEFVGQRTHELRVKEVARANELFDSSAKKLMNDLDGAIEWSVLNEKLRNLPGRYMFSADEGAFKFKPRSNDAVQAAEEIMEATEKGWPISISVKSSTVHDLIQIHMKRNQVYQEAKGLIRSNEGIPHRFEADIFYPIPRSPKNTPFFAFVIDGSVTGTGHTKMIYADTSEKLESMMRQVQELSPDLTVLTKLESEKYFKARGQYEFERSVHENWINNELARKGVSSSFLPQTDPKVILEELIGWHNTRSANMIREAVSHKYQRQFDALRVAAEDSLSSATSKFSYTSPQAYAENAVNNPASNLIKLALDISKIEEYPLWSSMNKMADDVVSRLTDKISRTFSDATSPQHLSAVTAALNKAGYGGPLPNGVTPALYEAMNSKIPRNVLTEFIGQANGLISTFALRLDPFNALNNWLGSHVLLGAETSSLLKAIKAGNEEAAGDLVRLMKVKVPGTEDLISSPGKLIANAISRYHTNPELRAFYRKHGFITGLTDQYHSVIEDVAASLARDGKIAESFSKMKGWAAKGEELTGNKFAEEFNRFVAADVMGQMTEVAVKAGVISEGTALTYINTFVNRTQGNFIASQRPLLFQGPVGQAIGLFQTYQFNLIQQLLRHVGEGSAKSAVTMMGLQGSIYGMNGLPAFNAINTHIVGNSAGNTSHTDLTNVAYSATGKAAGDWLMYGLGSNALGLLHPDLKTNLYTRGDVNPRSLTIVPTSPEDVPIVKATARFMGNVKDMFTQTSAGAPVWETFLRGVEHNGVSRPLAGLAQFLEGVASGRDKLVATNTHLNQVMAHDLYSLASGARVFGAKPLDESIVNDMMFRFQAYDRHDSAARSTLGEAIKMKILGGGDVNSEEIAAFTEQYVRSGGKQENFAKFMAANYRNANANQANQLKGALENPKVQAYQRLMGGYKLEDLSHQPQQ